MAKIHEIASSIIHYLEDDQNFISAKILDKGKVQVLTGDIRSIGVVVEVLFKDINDHEENDDYHKQIIGFLKHDGYEGVKFIYGDGDTLLFFIEEEIQMKKVDEDVFFNLVLEFLGEEIKEWESYGDGEITMNMEDCNLEIDGEDWYVVIEKYLEKHGCEVKFSAGNGHWQTIHLVNVL